MEFNPDEQVDGRAFWVKQAIRVEVGQTNHPLSSGLFLNSLVSNTNRKCLALQSMDNVHFNDLLHSSMSDTSSVTMPQSIKNDPKLFKDDIDIRFSRTLNSCKVGLHAG